MALRSNLMKTRFCKMAMYCFSSCHVAARRVSKILLSDFKSLVFVPPALCSGLIQFTPIAPSGILNRVLHAGQRVSLSIGTLEP